jgi:hypothetical protein
MQIDPTNLSDQQYFGLRCIVDGHVFVDGDHPVQVAYVGDDLHAIYACPGACTKKLAQPVASTA